MPTVTWKMQDKMFNSAFLKDIPIGYTYKSQEMEEKFFWVCGSLVGLESTLADAMRKVEETYSKRLQQ